MHIKKRLWGFRPTLEGERLMSHEAPEKEKQQMNEGKSSHGK
jgi:hypothetical protein